MNGLDDDAAGASVGNQRRRQLQKLCFGRSKPCLDLGENPFCLLWGTGVTDTDQMFCADAHFLQPLEYSFHGRIPAVFDGNRGNAGPVLGLCQHGQQLQRTAQFCCNRRQPSAAPEKVKILRNNKGYGRFNAALRIARASAKFSTASRDR